MAEEQKSKKTNLWQQFIEALGELFENIMNSIRTIHKRLSGEGHAHKLDKLKEAAYDQQANFRDHEKQFDNVLDASRMKINDLKSSIHSSKNDNIGETSSADIENSTKHVNDKFDPEINSDLDKQDSEVKSGDDYPDTNDNDNVINEGSKDVDDNKKGAEVTLDAYEQQEKNVNDNQEASGKTKDTDFPSELKKAASSVPQFLGRIPGIEMASMVQQPTFVGDAGYWYRNGNDAWDHLATAINTDTISSVYNAINSGNTDDIASLLFEIECSLAGDDLKDASSSVEHGEQFKIILLSLWNDSNKAAEDILNKDTDLGNLYLRWTLSKPDFNADNVLVKHLKERILNVKSLLNEEHLSSSSLIKASSIWLKSTEDRFDKNIANGNYPSNTADIPPENSEIIEPEAFAETEGYTENASDLNKDDAPKPSDANQEPDHGQEPINHNRGFKDEHDYEVPNHTPHVDDQQPKF